MLWMWNEYIANPRNKEAGHQSNIIMNNLSIPAYSNSTSDQEQTKNKGHTKTYKTKKQHNQSVKSDAKIEWFQTQISE